MDAVQLAQDWQGIPDDEPLLDQIPLDDMNEGPVVSVGGGTLYLSGEEAFTDTQPTGGPWIREIPVLFDQSTTFEEGDRLELAIGPRSGCGTLPSDAESTRVLYSDAGDTPSRLLLGQATQDILPGTFEACQEIDDNEDTGCGWIGGVRRNVPVECSEGRYKVEGFGPPGPRGLLSCGPAQAVCTVPGEPGDPWASCEAETTLSAVTSSLAARCTYLTEDDEQVDGEGVCTRMPGSTLDGLEG